MEILGIWIAALLTLAIYSFLYKDNPVYKFAEHLFVGITAGYSVGIMWHQVGIDLIYKPLFKPLEVERLSPDYLIIIPTILGLLMYLRLFPKVAWLSRWPICFVMGFGAGAAIPVVVANILMQSRSTIELAVLPLAENGGILWFAGLSNVIIVIAVITTLCYFYFSKEHKGTLGVAGKVGIWFLMICFGAGFGNTVMARISLLIGRFQFLIDDWWPTIMGISP